jgi:hypothetical protein
VVAAAEGLLGSGRGVDVVDGVAGGGGGLELGVADGGKDDAVVLGQDWQDREERLLDRMRVEGRQQDHERTVAAEAGDRAGEGGPVRLGDDRLEVGHRLLQPLGDVALAGEADPGAYAEVAGDKVDPVAGPGGDGGQQEPGIHRRVEPRHPAAGALDPGGRGAGGVEHQYHATVAFRLPGADDDGAGAGGGAPVDGAYVVATDVLPQRVELGSLSAHPHCGSAVELAQSLEPRGEVFARLEGGQHPHRSRYRNRALPRAETQGAVRPDRHAERTQISAAARPKRRTQPRAVPAIEPDPVAIPSSPRGRLPGIPHQRPDAPSGRADHQVRRRRLAQPDSAERNPADLEGRRLGRQEDVEERQYHHEQDPDRGRARHRA